MIPARELRQALLRTLLVLAALSGLALAVSFAFEPAELARGAPWQLLGIEAPACSGCALCGMSRAFAAAAHGRLGEALQSHGGIVLAWPLAWALVLYGALALARTLAPRRWTWRSPR
jgi:hypothetical protein